MVFSITEMIDTKSSVPIRWSSVLCPLATNNHWFSLSDGPLWMVAIGLADRGPMWKDRQFVSIISAIGYTFLHILLSFWLMHGTLRERWVFLTQSPLSTRLVSFIMFAKFGMEEAPHLHLIFQNFSSSSNRWEKKGDRKGHGQNLNRFIKIKISPQLLP